jgi:hypothetical protein
MNACACGKPLSRQNRSGKCRPCVAHFLNTDPEMIAKRVAGNAVYWSRPESKAAAAAHMARIVGSLSEEELERRRENGRRLAREVLSRPEVRALASSREVRTRAGAARTNTVLAWCPPELRDDYRALVRKAVPAKEARAMIEAQIVGTVAHARRSIANVRFANRLREERRRADVY